MRIAAVSDLHGNLPEVPECDVLVVGGDLGPATREYHDDDLHAEYWLCTVFIPWFRSQPARHVVVIAGNHDKYIERNGFPWKNHFPCFHYLQDSGCEIEGVKFWGSPWTPTFFDWAFMREDEHLALQWAAIPDDTDVLVTHGPPWGVLDQNRDGYCCGSVSLGERRAGLNLKLHVCGHLHEQGGKSVNYDGEIVANVSHVDERYRPVNPVETFEVNL